MESETQMIEESVQQLLADPINEKEEDLLKRQVILCQDAAKEDFRKFIGTVDMFEAMVYEDLEREKSKPDTDKHKVIYDTKAIENDVRKSLGMLPSQPLNDHIFYIIAIKKFQLLYKIFKKHHIPTSIEARVA